MGPIAGTQIKIIKLNQCRVQMSDTEICEILPWVDVKGCIRLNIMSLSVIKVKDFIHDYRSCFLNLKAFT